MADKAAATPAAKAATEKVPAKQAATKTKAPAQTQAPAQTPAAAPAPDAVPAPAAQHPYPVAAPTNALSIVSLVTSLVGLHLAGIITGHIALRQIAQTKESGRGLALAGLIIGYAVFGIAALSIILWLAGMGIMFAALGASTYGH